MKRRGLSILALLLAAAFGMGASVPGCGLEENKYVGRVDVKGRIHAADGVKVAADRLTIRLAADDRVFAPVNADGTFRLTVPGGAVHVLVLTGGEIVPTASAPLQVARGPRDGVILSYLTKKSFHALEDQMTGSLQGGILQSFSESGAVAGLLTRSQHHGRIAAEASDSGAQVLLKPPVEPHQGPFYFNRRGRLDVKAGATSTQSGFIFFNVSPGRYRLSILSAATLYPWEEIEVVPGAVSFVYLRGAE